MNSPILLSSVDSNLERVDYSSMSDQTLMELLFEGFDEDIQAEYQDGHGKYLDVCEWDYVDCDEDDRVISFDEEGDISGSLQLCYLPPKMQSLLLTYKELTGSVDLTQLPPKMESLTLDDNQFTGSVDLTKLPDTMGYLHLSGNDFEGSVDLTQLPESMKVLYLGKNRFEGSVDLTQFPQKMSYINIENNRFTGSFIAMSLPQGFKKVYASGNQFSAIAVVHSHENAEFDLRESGVTSAADENGDAKVEGIQL